MNTKLKNCDIKLASGDTTNYRVLEKWKIKEFSSIIILGYDHLGIQEKDGKSILTILHIRQILKDIDKNIVAEIYDEKNREIVELSKACDYIIGENIISSMMTQLSEQEELFWIFEELFDAQGCEIYLKPIGDYIDDFESEYNFYELLRSAANKNEIAIGYREMIYSQNMKYNYGVSINPIKDKKIKFSEDDKIVVIGRND